MARSVEPRVLQFYSSYEDGLLDYARQFASLFVGTSYRVTTVFLTGSPDAEVAAGCAASEVLFMDYPRACIEKLSLKAMRDLSVIAKTRSFSCCIAHGFKAIRLALLGTKLPVIGIHSDVYEYDGFLKKFFVNWYQNRLFLLGISHGVQSYLRQVFVKWPEDKIETLYGHIDVDAARGKLLSRIEARHALFLSDEAWLVGNIGALQLEQDQETLLRAFALAKPNLPANSQLVIVGIGRQADQLKMIAAELGVAEHVLFLGEVERARRYLKAFDLFVLSALNSSFNMDLLYAMAAGVPLLSSDCGSGREIVKDIGVVFPIGDERLLAEAMQHMSMLKSKQLQSCIDAMNVKLYSLFSDDSAAQAFWRLAMVQRLLASH